MLKFLNLRNKVSNFTRNSTNTNSYTNFTNQNTKYFSIERKTLYASDFKITAPGILYFQDYHLLTSN